VRLEAPINWNIVGTVALLCAVSLTLFFAGRGRDRTPAEAVVTSASDSLPSDTYSDLDYFKEEAVQFEALLPLDKEIIVRLIDSVNHHIIYIEKDDMPSCYSYDLETLITSVLFAGEYGFYCGTKLLIPGKITDWKIVDGTIVFVAMNREPEAKYENATVVFSMDLHDHQLRYIDSGNRAFFVGDNYISIVKAQLLSRNFFFGEDRYREFTVNYELSPQK